MNAPVGPIKVYTPEPSRLYLLVIGLVTAPLIILPRIGVDLFEPPVLIFVSALSVGLGLYVGVFTGRQWVYLYDDRVVLQGPAAHLLQRMFRLPAWRTTVYYRDITALGRSPYEAKGSFLVLHRVGRVTGRKFFVACASREQYFDIKAELLRRVRPECKLYLWKGFGRRGPF
jgi:hypothetical protein